MGTRVTDPSILAQLEADDDQDISPRRVTDPAILAQLNQPEKRGLAGLMSDLKDKAWEAPFKVGEMLAAIPGQAYEAGKQIAQDPLPHPLQMMQDPKHFLQYGGAFPRIAQNVLSGILNTGGDVASAPGKALSYAADLGLAPEKAGEFGKKAIIPETGLKKAVMGDEQPGDEFWQQLAPMLLLKKPLTKAPITTSAALSTLTSGDPFTGALAGAVGKATGAIGEKAGEAVKPFFADKAKLAAEVEAATAQHEKLAADLENMQTQSGVDTPKALEKKIFSANEKLQDLQKEAAQKAAEPMDTEEIPSIEQQQQAVDRQKQTLDKYQQVADTHKNVISEAEETINKNLGKGLTHNEHIARAIYEPQMEIQKGIKKEYQDIHKELKEMNIISANNDKIVELSRDLKTEAENAFSPAFKQKLRKTANELAGTNEDGTITAHELVNQWRSMRDTDYNLMQDAKNEPDALTRDKIFKDAQIAIKQAEKLKKAMQDGIPPEYYDRLMKNNEEFKAKVIPLRENAVWKQIAKNIKISGKDLIEKLGGEGAGQAILRQHILNNPKASDLMLGSRVAGKPKVWHDYHEASAPYLHASSPETKSALVSHWRGLEGLDKANAAIEAQTKIHDDSMKELSKQTKAQEKARSSEQTKIEKKKTEQDKIQADIDAQVLNLKRMQERLPKLKEATKAKNMSLDEKVKAEAEFKKANNAVNNAKNSLLKALGSGLSTATGLKVLSKIF